MGIKSDWKGIQQNNENSQIISREFDGSLRGKYWLIVFAHNFARIDAKTSIQSGDILIFDVPSCVLTWIIPNSSFKLNISPSCHFSAYRYSMKVYICSYGIVLMRRAARRYGNIDTN